MNELLDAISEAVSAAPVGETASLEHGNVTITIYGQSRVNLTTPTPGVLITLCTPGESPTQVAPATWEELTTAVEEAQDSRDWDVRVQQQQAELAQRKLDKLDREKTQLLAARREAVKRLSLRWVSAYRIAQILNLSQPQIARILTQAGVK